jgi:hypothetical protein
MTSKACRVSASVLVLAAGLVTITALPSEAEALQPRLRDCDQIEDARRRENCRSAVYDAQRYRNEESRAASDRARILDRAHRGACVLDRYAKKRAKSSAPGGGVAYSGGRKLGSALAGDDGC